MPLIKKDEIYMNNAFCNSNFALKYFSSKTRPVSVKPRKLWEKKPLQRQLYSIGEVVEGWLDKLPSSQCLSLFTDCRRSLRE